MDPHPCDVSKETAQTRSAAYRLAYRDVDFLLRDSLRPLRFQLELLKPDMMLDEAGVDSTFVIYGSARIAPPGGKSPARFARYYDEARALARLASGVASKPDGRRDFVVCSGGGPSIMEAANRGAADVGRDSIGLNIVPPFEQAPNGFVSPELCFNFHYFALRKMHFLLRAKAVAVFPGGFGTLDELFDLLTLMQTQKMDVVPVLLFDEAFWRGAIGFDMLAETGMISPADLALFSFVDTADEAWAAVEDFYARHPEPRRHRR